MIIPPKKRSFPFSRLLALVTLVLVLCVCTNGACHVSIPHGETSTAQSSLAPHDYHHDTPCCPQSGDESHSDCDSCLSCPCHSSLTAEPFLFVHRAESASLSVFEPFTHLPEVYLSLFVPPDIRA